MKLSDESVYDLSIGDLEDYLFHEFKISVKSHTIRFWVETFPHIDFQVRFGNRRYFSKESAFEFVKIHRLSELGLTLKGIKSRVKHGKIKCDNNITDIPIKENIQQSRNLDELKIVVQIDNILKKLNHIS